MLATSGRSGVCLIPRVLGIVAEIKSIAAIDNWDAHGVEELRERVYEDSFEITCATTLGELTIKLNILFSLKLAASKTRQTFNLSSFATIYLHNVCSVIVYLINCLISMLKKLSNIFDGIDIKFLVKTFFPSDVRIC